MSIDYHIRVQVRILRLLLWYHLWVLSKGVPESERNCGFLVVAL